MMDEDRFWEIVDASRRSAIATPRGSHDDLIEIHERTLADLLEAMAPKEIVGFQARFSELHHTALTCLISLSKGLYTADWAEGIGSILFDPSITDWNQQPLLRPGGSSYGMQARSTIHLLARGLPGCAWRSLTDSRLQSEVRT